MWSSTHTNDIYRQTLLRSKRLRANANKIPYNSFRVRKNFFNNPENGIFKDRGASQSPMNPMMNNPMMDPTNMVDMMKKNMVMVVPQLFIMSWVSYFFSGFVLGT